MDNLKILSIIPARSGSKGLINKNILPLLNKPLISWTIEASLQSKYISYTIVNSDSKAILDIAKKYNSNTLMRPNNLALDNTPSEFVVQHTISELRKQNLEFDFIILLQPTSPLRNNDDIDNAFKLLLKSSASSLISVYKTDNKILKAFIENEYGYIKGISNNKYPFTTRQKLPKTYMSNGAIYIVKVSEFLKNNSLFTNNSIKYTMNEEKSLDIDTQNDLDMAQNYLYKISSLANL